MPKQSVEPTPTIVRKLKKTQMKNQTPPRGPRRPGSKVGRAPTPADFQAQLAAVQKTNQIQAQRIAEPESSSSMAGQQKRRKRHQDGAVVVKSSGSVISEQRRHRPPDDSVGPARLETRNEHKRKRSQFGSSEPETVSHTDEQSSRHHSRMARQQSPPTVEYGTSPRKKPKNPMMGKSPQVPVRQKPREIIPPSPPQLSPSPSPVHAQRIKQLKFMDKYTRGKGGPGIEILAKRTKYNTGENLIKALEEHVAKANGKITETLMKHTVDQFLEQFHKWQPPGQGASPARVPQPSKSYHPRVNLGELAAWKGMESDQLIKHWLSVHSRGGASQLAQRQRMENEFLAEKAAEARQKTQPTAAQLTGARSSTATHQSHDAARKAKPKKGPPVIHKKPVPSPVPSAPAPERHQGAFGTQSYVDLTGPSRSPSPAPDPAFFGMAPGSFGRGMGGRRGFPDTWDPTVPLAVSAGRPARRRRSPSPPHVPDQKEEEPDPDPPRQAPARVYPPISRAARARVVRGVVSAKRYPHALSVGHLGIHRAPKHYDSPYGPGGVGRGGYGWTVTPKLSVNQIGAGHFLIRSRQGITKGIRSHVLHLLQRVRGRYLKVNGRRHTKKQAIDVILGMLRQNQTVDVLLN